MDSPQSLVIDLTRDEESQTENIPCENIPCENIVHIPCEKCARRLESQRRRYEEKRKNKIAEKLAPIAPKETVAPIAPKVTVAPIAQKEL